MVPAYLLRCIQLAKLADSHTFPNPKVGAVIVHQDRIIGEGYHEKAGGPHAEVAAIEAVKEPHLLADATLYVSLEPCNHFGKTPPCANLILKHKIPHVVVGCLDPNPQMAGKSVEKLRAAGVKVEVCENPEPFQALNKIFFVNQLEKRPFICLKWAESWDGFLARKDAQGNLETTAITQHLAKIYTHQLRAAHHAIMVGLTTAKIDNPQLTVRHFVGKNPIRIVLDRFLELSPTLNLFTDGEAQTIVINEKKEEVQGQVTYFCPQDLATFDNITQLCQELYERLNICSILVEGGTNLLSQFIDYQYFDEIYRFRGAKLVKNGLAAPNLPKHFVWKERIQLGNDSLKRYEKDI
ncbi:MAG: bifunctional diaminohydroxyphosphoribosylaminopyrimidine deaminase/5-amino-6-(5-phosphoribosylamino)uracil reductase RibD [Bacteroidia bacterium]